jgi:hypothetical protein
MDATMDKQKMAQCHKQAAQHLEKAAKCHQEAAKHHEAGDHEKASCEAHKAHGHACCAKEHAAEAAKCCAGIKCE